MADILKPLGWLTLLALGACGAEAPDKVPGMFKVIARDDLDMFSFIHLVEVEGVRYLVVSGSHGAAIVRHTP